MRLRASTLESFRLFRNEDWMTADRFLSQLSESEPEDAISRMALGTAFHAMLEKQPELIADHDMSNAVYLSDGFVFDAVSFDTITNNIQKLKIVPEIYNETKVGEHILTGHCDGMEGLTVHEFKTTEKPIDIMKYVQSIQWKCYLELFGGCKVSYHIFKLKLDKKLNVYFVDDYQSVDLYRYANMRKEVERLCFDFVDFLKYHDINVTDNT